ncbi:MAG: FtsX-like permease family protein [Gammaproteobacteria bacterium]|nr:FtsX-like permease family protein [Gammaproteobacteria bacterium]
MFRPLAVNVGLRYAASRRRFVSFVGVAALAGLVLSVGVLLYVQAVVRGFERELENRVLGVVPHVTLVGRNAIADSDAVAAQLLGVPGVKHVAPVTSSGVLLSTGTGVAVVRLKGIVPADYETVIGHYFEAGSVDVLEPGSFNVVLGRGVMQRLGLEPGDVFTAVMPDLTPTPLGVFPARKRLRAAGTLRTWSQLDGEVAYTHIRDAQRLFRSPGSAGALELRIDAVLEAPDVASRALAVVGTDRFTARTWLRSMGPVYRAIQVTKGMLFLIFSLLVAVAAFNVVSGLVMIVNERRADVAILRTLGARSGLIVGVFVVLGLMVSLAGVGLGLVLGLGLGTLTEDGYRWAQETWNIDLMGEYFVHQLPVEFAVSDVVRVLATACGLSLLATLYPAWRAGRLRPAEVLRHE